MMESIDGNILTVARSKRKDVRITESDRGGIQYQTISYLDVLFENDVITKAQWQYGHNYWVIRDTAFPLLQAKIGKYDYTPPVDESILQGEITPEELAAEGMACEIYLAITRLIHSRDITPINAACNTLESDYLPSRMIIIQAFGENTLRWAFESLELNYPKAKEIAEGKIANEK